MESRLEYQTTGGQSFSGKSFQARQFGPGWIDGESLQKMLGPLYDVAMETERKTHPMRTTATPDDVAAVIELLCSDAASLMNGTTVDADGDGVFAFCGRYAMVGAALAAKTGGPADASDAPSVPDA